MNDTSNGSGAAATDDGTQSITIQGLDFTAPAPYAEGHPLTAAEAAVLNQTLGENLRNNFAKRVKDAKEKSGDGQLPEDVIESLRGEFADYAEGYEFAGKRSPRVAGDPVLREARKMAKSAIIEMLKKKDMDPKTLPEGRLEEFISRLLEQKPAYRIEAERRVNAAKAVASEALDLDQLAA